MEFLGPFCLQKLPPEALDLVYAGCSGTLITSKDNGPNRRSIDYESCFTYIQVAPPAETRRIFGEVEETCNYQLTLAGIYAFFSKKP